MIKLKKRSLFVPALMCAMASLFYGFEDILRVLPGSLAPFLYRDLGLDAASLGLMASFFYWGYAPMQMPAGLILDRLGPRRCLWLTAGLAAVATAMFAASTDFRVLIFSRFCIGVASAMAYLAALMLIANWLPRRYFAVAVGGVQLVGCLGAVLGQAPVTWSLNYFSWRSSVWLLSALCGGLALLYGVCLRDQPADQQDQSKDKKLADGWWSSVMLVLSQPQTWWLGGYAFLVWAPIAIFAVLWGIPFLHATYLVSETQAAVWLSAVWIGVAVGGPYLGWLSTRCSRRCLPMALGGALGGVATMILVYQPGLSTVGLLSVLFIMGVASSAQAVSFGAVFDRQPAHLLGVASGFNNMAVVMGGFICQPIVGMILKSHALSRGSTVHAEYFLSDYQSALWLLPVCYLCSALLSVIAVKETYCQPCAV